MNGCAGALILFSALMALQTFVFFCAMLVLLYGGWVSGLCECGVVRHDEEEL